MLAVTVALKAQQLLVLLQLFIHACLGQAQAGLTLDSSSEPVIAFTNPWHALGPFRIGTREAVWGADPLEAVGGFKAIRYDENSGFRNSLTPNATVYWVSHELIIQNDREETRVQFSINHENVDWKFQQEVYGWPALQYQTWIRGTLQNRVPKKLRVWVFTEGILELAINGQPFFGGDFFSFNRAPILVDLAPGLNVFDVRLVRDVRAKGGRNPSPVEGALRVMRAGDELEIDYRSTIVPDIVDDRLPSWFFSLAVRNPLSVPIVVKHCQQDNANILWAAETEFLSVAPGQTRSIGLQISKSWRHSKVLEGVLCYSLESTHDQQLVRLPFAIPLRHSSISEASKFTFLNPSGVVSYAVLKPPARRSVKTELPLMLFLHGADVEADGDLVRHSLDEMPDLEAFALFPTGMSPWAGDDWHSWGTADALSAIDAVHDWIAAMEWDGVIPTTERLVLIGHSNGGQGAWFFATHLPDRIIAAAPLSAYTSIETYIHYGMWREADPLQSSILNTARGSYRHESLLENLAHIPLLQQHGSADDNVPAYHSRLMSAALSEIGMPSHYFELAGMPHYWDGILTTEPLRKLYRDSLRQLEPFAIPLKNFSMIIPGCGEIASKFGIVVDQLRSPDRFGRVNVSVISRNGTPIWELKTTNIYRLHFDFTHVQIDAPLRIYLDSSKAPIVVGENSRTLHESCVRTSGIGWKCSKDAWKDIGQRYGRQKGALDSILQSRGSFQIVSCTEDPELGVQVSRNLFQYYGADSSILPCNKYIDALNTSGNVILLSDMPDIYESQLNQFPIAIVSGQISLQNKPSDYHELIAGDPGVGAIFLRPLKDERLELVIWGSDSEGLKSAGRLAPTVTGAGQPDFVVVGPKAKVLGHGGTLAMGFFDYSWNISRASFLPQRNLSPSVVPTNSSDVVTTTLSAK